MLRRLVKDRVDLTIYILGAILLIFLIIYYKTQDIKMLTPIYILIDIFTALKIYKTAKMKEYKTYRMIIFMDILKAAIITYFIFMYTKGLQDISYWPLMPIVIAVLDLIKPIFIRDKYKNQSV